MLTRLIKLKRTDTIVTLAKSPVRLFKYPEKLKDLLMYSDCNRYTGAMYATMLVVNVIFSLRSKSI